MKKEIKNINIFEKTLQSELYWILAEFKWGKISNNPPNTSPHLMATVCSNASKGINTCCGGCPTCDCHKEIDKYVDKILKLK